MVYGNANYWYTRNLLLNGGGAVTQNSGSDADTVTFTSLLAGGTYTADPMRFGEWLYTPSLGANAATSPEARRARAIRPACRATTASTACTTWTRSSRSRSTSRRASRTRTTTERAGFTTFTNYGGVSYRVMGTESLSGIAS